LVIGFCILNYQELTLSVETLSVEKIGVAQCDYEFPHPQPFSLGRRELKFWFPLLWERARGRA